MILSERTNASITCDLYWKYDQYCRDNNYAFVSTWGLWLDKYRDTCSKQFKKFQDNNKERGRLCDARDSRKHSVVRYSRGLSHLIVYDQSLSILLVKRMTMIVYFTFDVYKLISRFYDTLWNIYLFQHLDYSYHFLIIIYNWFYQGGLSEIQIKLGEAAKSLSTSHGIELKKSLVALRKYVLEKGTKNPLVKKFQIILLLLVLLYITVCVRMHDIPF